MRPAWGGEAIYLLFQSTVDIESPGFDYLSGFGRLDAGLAVAAVIPEPGPSALLAAIACFGSIRRRRQPGVLGR